MINGYKEPFLIPNTTYEKYLSGTSFEEIFALYEFDRKLRIITLEYVLEIEKQVKSLISYCFSKVHGHKNYDHVCSLLGNLYKKISLNIDKDLSVSHYVSGKNYVPLWVLVNTLSMGDISKFYSNMIQKERNDVARRLKWGTREHQLASCLFFLSTIRNRCAHDERLYSYLSYASLCHNKYFNYFHRTTDTNNYFSVMVAFKMLLSNKRYQTYHSQIDTLFNELGSQLATISVRKINGLMGLPNNWRRLKNLQ